VRPFGSDTHHGVLVVSNHDTIAPNSGFDTHPHRNMEIVTWVLSGSLIHQDSEGHSGTIYPNLAQRMTAGRGIRHSEKNDSAAYESGGGPPLDLIQMWVVPDELACGRSGPWRCSLVLQRPRHDCEVLVAEAVVDNLLPFVSQAGKNCEPVVAARLEGEVHVLKCQ
jgi:hypothetical protein